MNKPSTAPAALPRPVEELTIRGLSSAAELRGCQDLQRRAFGISEDGYVVPVATMAAVAKAGGLVLGAYVGGGLVGFSFAFLGRIEGAPVLFSQVTAVEPAQQRRGVGRALKSEQRHRARAMGLTSVVWTFDPLRSDNAHFNLAVLGATCRIYEIDLYGARSDALSAGLETDRLFAEWSTGDATDVSTERWADGVELIEFASGGAARGTSPLKVRDVPASTPRLHVEIPPDLDLLKRKDPALARSWQLLVRAALRTAFADGFAAVGFARGKRPAYLLERRD